MIEIKVLEGGQNAFLFASKMENEQGYVFYYVLDGKICWGFDRVQASVFSIGNDIYVDEKSRYDYNGVFSIGDKVKNWLYAHKLHPTPEGLHDKIRQALIYASS